MRNVNTTGTIKEMIIESWGVDLRLISVDQSKYITQRKGTK